MKFKRIGIALASMLAMTFLGLAILWAITPSGRDLPQITTQKSISQYPRLTGEMLPNHLVYALVAVEDERYFQHHGVDSYGLARALWHDLKGRCLCEGGSTLTQQLVKMVYYPSTPPLKRKIPGALVALKVESQYSKKEILTDYLNIVPMGSNVTGAYAASCLYFGHSPSHLTWAEAALLAGIPNAPSAYDPRYHPELANLRRHHVLLRLEALKYITPSVRQVAEASPLITPQPQGCLP